MQIQRNSSNWNHLSLSFPGYIDGKGNVIQGDVTTMIPIGIDEVGRVFDQLLGFGNSNAESFTIDLNKKQVTFDRIMATELLRICEQVWFDYEIGDNTCHLPQEEWTEEYLLSL